MGFRDEGEKLRDARSIEGKFLDALVYPVQDVHDREMNFLQLRHGTVLLEKDFFAENLMKKIDRLFNERPKPPPEDELQVIRVWIRKMLGRIAKGDIEGNYRRAWLQFD